MTSSVSQVLVPFKFLLIMFQLILIIMIIITKDQYILAELGAGSTTSSSGYDTKNNTVLALTILFLIFLAFELILLFIGFTLFTDQVNIVNIILHILGNVASLWFVVDTWETNLLYFIWVCFGLIPFGVEIYALIKQIIHNKSLIKMK